MLEDLRQKITEANLELSGSGLARLTWGSVSGIDRDLGLIVITPDGISHESLKPGDHVIVDLRGGVVQGGLAPSSDTRAHIELYRRFPQIGGITHTHSVYATMFAQAGREISCLGMTHADCFRGTVLLTRELTPTEASEDRASNTGKVIIERIAESDPMDTPAMLVPRDGPFAWGRDALVAVKNAKALEAIAEMAFGTCLLRGDLAASGPVNDP